MRTATRICVLVAAMAATSAAGQTPSRSLVAFDAERLRLSAAATDSLLVDTGRLLPVGGYRLSLVADYERDLLVLKGADGATRSLLHHRTMTWFMGAWSPVERLELSARLPVIVSQGGDGAEALAGVFEPASSGLGTPEVGARYALLRREDGAPLSLAAGLDVGLPGGRASAFGRQEHWAGFQFSPRVSLGREVGPFAVGASVGARVRAKEVEPGRDIGSELEQALVVATRGDGLRGEVALQVAESLVHSDVAAELLGGVRLPFARGFELSAIAGRSLSDVPGLPAWRVGLGIAWAPRSASSDADRAPASEPALEADEAAEEAGAPEDAEHEEPDSDGDGVADAVDQCPAEPGVSERQGCPEPPLPPVEEVLRSLTDRKLVFALGEAEIQEEVARTLDEVAELLKARPDVSIRVEGHTDTTGPEQFNERLSQQRADAVRNYLVERGVDGSRLEARGYGPTRPAVSNDTLEGRKANRRVELVVEE